VSESEDDNDRPERQLKPGKGMARSKNKVSRDINGY